MIDCPVHEFMVVLDVKDDRESIENDPKLIRSMTLSMDNNIENLR